ncbi:Muscle M-line assembly protein unc-89, putative isoform 2 [Hibiscus syriacus]|uniref:Muscle M-line assembly protein unc-89, putative isoform 2 n=1 Tax=Hibiscus syriacus TaxID=106335 RepID=A0A6A3BEC1_HIBSY|nr:Muscle M-line assembly protein unc-89, putative isoform 2 [Hibiscus syriacus]
MLDEQLTKEWLESVEQRKTIPRPKGSKRAPKSPEQRRKIAEAIAAKWADPISLQAVALHLNKGLKENQRGSRQLAHSLSRALPKGKLMKQAVLLLVKLTPIERLRLLITNAEKAAKALELPAVKSPVARASLIETRKLIAEAIQSIESIKGGWVTSNENGGYVSVDSAEPVIPIEKTMQSKNSSLSQADKKEVNGNHFLSLSEKNDLSFPNFMLPRILNGDSDEEPTPSSTTQPVGNKLDYQWNQSSGERQDKASKAVAVTKKWVHGRLVEVAEGASQMS